MHPLSSMFDASLKKSASLDLPPAVELPRNIHPLPADITQYFVYTFGVENFVLHPHPPHVSHEAQLEQLQQKRASSAAFLEQRQAEKETKRREALRRIAPGYNDQSAAILQPEKRDSYPTTSFSSPVSTFPAEDTVSSQDASTSIPAAASSSHAPSPSTASAAADELAAIFGQQKV